MLDALTGRSDRLNAVHRAAALLFASLSILTIRLEQARAEDFQPLTSASRYTCAVMTDGSKKIFENTANGYLSIPMETATASVLRDAATMRARMKTFSAASRALKKKGTLSRGLAVRVRRVMKKMRAEGLVQTALPRGKRKQVESINNLLSMLKDRLELKTTELAKLSECTGFAPRPELPAPEGYTFTAMPRIFYNGTTTIVGALITTSANDLRPGFEPWTLRWFCLKIGDKTGARIFSTNPCSNYTTGYNNCSDLIPQSQLGHIEPFQIFIGFTPTQAAIDTALNALTTTLSFGIQGRVRAIDGTYDSPANDSDMCETF